VAVFGDKGRYPVGATKHDTVLGWAVVDIGASGAATTTTNCGITCVKSATGVYDVTFAPFPAQSGSHAYIKMRVLKSATPTVSQATCLAYDLAAGTAQFKTALNAAATGVEPASGDQLLIQIVGGYTGIA
jgi:hypothetical protein